MQEMEFKTIILTKPDGVGKTALNRPQDMDPLNSACFRDIIAAVRIFLAALAFAGCLILRGFAKAENFRLIFKKFSYR